MLIEPDIITRSNRKTLSISITREGNVVVKVPNQLPSSEVNKFLLSKQGWIKSKLESINKNRSDNSDVISYQKIMLFGTKYMGYRSLEVKKIVFDNDRFLIPNKITAEKLLPSIKKWYKNYALNVLEERINQIQKNLKLKAKKISIIDAKARWGSCNNSGEIALNWRIIMLRPRLIDYVLVHELAHLIELNHSTKFWQVVGLVMPDWLVLRKEIKQFNFLLDLFR